MKIDRLIGILTTLLQQEKTTAPELAKRFEVSRKTISRDIDTLCEAGIPIITLQGYEGGISISEDFRLDAALLSEEEIQTLLAGVQGLESVTSRPDIGALREKLVSRKSTCIANDIFVIDLASHYQGTLSEKIDRLKTAITKHNLVTFTYHYSRGSSTRTIEPYRIIFKWNTWYLFGYCLARKDFRLFKLHRLWDLDVSDESFKLRPVEPEQWSFNGYFSQRDFCLKALFAPQAKYRLVEEYGPNCYSEQEDGRLAFEEAFADYGNMKEWVLRFGDDIQVLEPKELREEIIVQAKKILQIYDQQDI